jgi:hypothetical protein
MTHVENGVRNDAYAQNLVLSDAVRPEMVS